MPRKRTLLRVFSIFLIILGLVLGVSWNSEGFCIGDNIFTALSLPAWSAGSSGTHYPAVVGSIAILVGIGALNCTLQEKTKKHLWMVVVLAYVILNVITSYI